MESGGGVSYTSIRSLVQLQNSRHPPHIHKTYVHIHEVSVQVAQTPCSILPPRCFRGLWVPLTWAPAIRCPLRHPKVKPWQRLPGSEQDAADGKVTPGKGPQSQMPTKNTLFCIWSCGGRSLFSPQTNLNLKFTLAPTRGREGLSIA